MFSLHSRVVKADIRFQGHLNVPKVLSRCAHTERRTSRSGQVDNVSVEDLGVIDTYRIPKHGTSAFLFSPYTLLKCFYHTYLLKRWHLMSFNRMLKPAKLSPRLLTLHALQLRARLLDSIEKQNLKEIRAVCGMRLQSKLIRTIKSRSIKNSDSPTIVTTDERARARLINFTQQPTNTERTKSYAQAVVRVHGLNNHVEDIILTTKSWKRPITWTIQDIK